jgi:hypothetical protein
MRNDGLQIMTVGKVESATLVTIQRTHTLEYPEPSEQMNAALYRTHVMSFVLTRLSCGGTVIGEWKKEQCEAVWRYTNKVSSSFEHPEMEETILAQNPGLFRMTIGPFGMGIMNNAYFGAGVFLLRFFNEPVPEEDIRLACMLSNIRDTGFWIRLQRI